MPHMKREHANAILQGGARMPMCGEPCDASCQFYFACAQFTENGICRGFLLKSNGSLSQHIKANVAEACATCLKEIPCDGCTKKTLSTPDRLGIQSYVEMIQRTHDPETLQHLVPVVHRYLTPPQSRKQTTQQGNVGFRSMLDRVSNPQKQEKEKLPQPPVACMSGFERQLEAAQYGGSQDTVRTVIAAHEEKVVPRNYGMGFRNMLDSISPEKTERMLPIDNRYFLSKPSKSTIFDFQRKKKDVSATELLAMLKERLRVAKQAGQKILIVYYQTLIRKLERELGTRTVQRTAGFRNMLEMAFK